ncbi:beta-ketoacyl synthase [Stappia sp. TSB10P1A]|uniref:beta-ketoacyl-[acyl-carrier-protein] synthase family protein n=1 Tax=Stappia sp. TSB10P1A TaxID=2003585 RepID=UPI001643C2D5|nr:beta-ketoacyl-[acyl-carrier-protein] synthase family protein [Stappia sp. TSB10P1A]
MTAAGRRVVVTGLGAITAAGSGVPALWEAAREGRSGVSDFRLDRYPRQRITRAAHIAGFDPAAHLSEQELKTTDRFAQLALVAAAEALTQAGLDTGAPLGPRFGAIIGSGIGGSWTTDDGHYAFYVTETRTDLLTIAKVMPNAAASQISMRYGVRGPSLAISSACASGTQAVGYGLQMIRAGMADAMLVGGSEALLTPATFRAWEVLRVMAPETCRPFSDKRNGMVLGEGAAVLVIEELEHALKRGATPLAEIAGYGTTSDAGDLLRPTVEGPAAAMANALADAGLTPRDIGYVNAHGTGTVLNDISESEALRQVFGAHIGEVSVSSTKPIHGHALGAAGAIELVITVQALRDNIAPPTINWLAPDPKCLADPVPNTARARPIDAAISNSFAFGGINATIAIRKV